MIHLTKITGSDLEGYWYSCECGEEGTRWESMSPVDNLQAAKDEADIHIEVNLGD